MAYQSDAIHRLLDSFQGSRAEKRRLGKILRDADFFPNDYGVLAYSLAEMQVAGGKMTTAV